MLIVTHERACACQLGLLVLLFRHLNLRLPAPNLQATEINVVTNRNTPMSSAVAEMTEIVRAAAEPWNAGDSVKAGINRASRRLGLSPRRAVTFWYARQSAVLAEEADRLRAWYRAHNEQEAARLEARAAELRARAKTLEERINGVAVALAGQGGVCRG